MIMKTITEITKYITRKACTDLKQGTKLAAWNVDLKVILSFPEESKKSRQKD